MDLVKYACWKGSSINLSETQPPDVECIHGRQNVPHLVAFIIIVCRFVFVVYG